MAGQSHEVSPPGVRRKLRMAAGWIVGLGCLGWVLHDVQFSDIVQDTANLAWGWVAAAIVLHVISYGSQGLRWQLLLRPVGVTPVLKTTQAIYAGLFANEVLPLRFGELVRTYLVSRWMSKRLVSVLPSVAVERLFDAIWLAVAIGLTAVMVPLPEALVRAAQIFGGVVLAASAGFFYLAFKKHDSTRVRRWRVIRWVDSLIAGLGEIRRSAPVYEAFAVSFLFLVLQAASFWLVMLAYGLRTSFWVGAAAFLIVRLGTAVPNAPANVGTFQFFTVVALTLFGIEKTQAAGFSLVVFVLLTIPLWALGFAALSWSGATLGGIRAELGKTPLEVR